MYFRILFIHLIPFLHSNVEIEAKLLSPISENRACLVSDKFLLERDRKKHNYRTFSKYIQIKGKVFKIFSRKSAHRPKKESIPCYLSQARILKEGNTPFFITTPYFTVTWIVKHRNDDGNKAITYDGNNASMSREKNDKKRPHLSSSQDPTLLSPTPFYFQLHSSLSQFQPCFLSIDNAIAEVCLNPKENLKKEGGGEKFSKKCRKQSKNREGRSFEMVIRGEKKETSRWNSRNLLDPIISSRFVNEFQKRGMDFVAGITNPFLPIC